ncbi:hypothetical protein Nepgr_024843 [Nepenthes gracilis]|uniref:Integrator complex subunit 4/Protein SIEL C-terminal Ig-like domain-containing protein n=1 Tax=Nepenthes gracilis TaxID=150966 RepID=A0AAD3T3Z2_NEPGR|nr:hypothetical protein Nepgr_024843 [Nepenthes gracilis]
MEATDSRELDNGAEDFLSSRLAAHESLSLQKLSSIRSLIVNPSTPEDTVASILKFLTRSLHDRDHDNHHHVLSLLSDLSLGRPQLSDLIFDSVLSLSSSLLRNADSSTLLAAAALSLLLSLAVSSPSLCCATNSLDDVLVISLCFRPCPAVRLWLLSNVMRFPIRPHLLFTVLLGCTKDPYPSVRRAGLDGLASACKSGVVIEDCGIIEGCYYRAVELLGDSEDCVRAAAVRVVSEWGKMLVASKDEEDKRDSSNALFLQLCSVVRDMSVGVRVESLYALGRVEVVSEDILLQSLSKRVLGSIKEMKPLVLCGVKHYEIHATCAAGAFVHGLEDEYNEVRQASCASLSALNVLSVQFASEAVTLLTDVLNDDSVVVRLQALGTIHHIITCNCLMMQPAQMHMILSTLSDKSPQIRIGAVNILGSIKLPDMEMFKLSVQSLLRNLEMYPQDEDEVLHALFEVIQNNGSYAVGIVEDAYHEIRPLCGGKLEFDSPRAVGLMVLAISATLFQETCSQYILQRLLSYAAVFFGRICHALVHEVDKDTFLTYLRHHGGLTFLSTFKDEGCFLSNTGGDGLRKDIIQRTSYICTSPQRSNWFSEMWSQCMPRQAVVPLEQRQIQAHVDVLKSVKLSFAAIKNLWQLINSGCTSEALTALRSCKEELEIIRADSLESAGTLAFGLQCIQMVKLLAKLWEQYLPTGKRFHWMVQLDLLLGKLDKRLLELRYRFIGLSKEDELYILELVLLSCVLRLSRFLVCCKTLKKLSKTISHVVLFCEEHSVVSSDFVNQLANVLQEHVTSFNGDFHNPLHYKMLLDLFSLKDFVLSHRIKHMKADLQIPGFDSETRLPFISGLPVGIPLEITLYNVTSENRLWIKISLDELCEFVFMDPDQFGDCNEVTRILFNAPFYSTPRAIAFTLKFISSPLLSANLFKLMKC